MSNELSFNEMIDALRSGDSAATERLWGDFQSRIKGLTRKYLPPNQRRSSDESDVVISVMDSFLSGIRKDQYPNLNDPDDVWNLVAKITQFKAIDHRRRATKERNRLGCAPVSGESAIDALSTSDIERRPIEQIADKDYTPDEVAWRLDEFIRLFDLLPADPEYRIIALLDLTGYTKQSIADLLEMSKRSVERRVQRIWTIWNSERERLQNEDA